MKDEERWPWIIVGGGLAGLTAAWFLRPRRALILERGPRVGGLCRSERRQGFTFDRTGHLLHFKHPEIRDWVMELLPRGTLEKYHRRAWVYVYDRWVHYPFQVHLGDLPRDVAYECLEGFIRLFLDSPDPPANPTFRDWIEWTFGPGIARHFMIPYNRKFWCRDLDALTPDWVSWSIPRPDLEDVLKGALGLVDREYGYNPVFWYPRAGGIEVLPRTIAAGLDHVWTRCRVVRIEWRNHRVWIDSGDGLTYDTLISTIPLPELVRLLDPLPDPLREDAERLESVAVLNFNLGIRGDPPIDAHWIYFPEERFPFYRVGFASAFSEAMAPPGTHSLYVEVSLRQAPGPDEIEGWRERVFEGLTAAGLLGSSADILVDHRVVIQPAYVVFNRARAEVLPRIREFLARHDIRTTGRFGAWDYYSMDDTMAAARTLALEYR